MSRISRDEVRRVAELARLSFDDAEAGAMAAQLDTILDVDHSRSQVIDLEPHGEQAPRVRFGRRQRAPERGDVGRLELDDPASAVERVRGGVAFHDSPPAPRSQPRPNDASPWRSMLRRVPVGMSREWMGTTIDAPLERRHFWWAPS
jgi:Asp-tRNA(Asn)/Glu-tRNA(Gln) amidotransferase C subunit